ncbi:MAG: hypothetical protein IT582_01920 [Opitutaceae bacterium]|nr:hypothetical protein [Opitutaceae bacterium]
MTQLTKHRPFKALLCALAFTASAGLLRAEHNLWPLLVEQTDATTGETTDRQILGPLIFSKTAPDGARYEGLRPLWLEHADAAAGREERSFLYPLYSWRRDTTTEAWTVFNVINHSHAQTGASAFEPRKFDVWPFWFSRDTGDPATSYRALLPIAGTIKHRFGQDQIDWTLFPLYLRTEKSGMVTTATPWPFIKRITGDGHDGFAVWPLFGRAEKPGAYRKRSWLWPLIYKNELRLSDPVPTVMQGFLPFYTREQSAGAVSENFLWPFFGYTRQTAPAAYHENRYLWPLLVQGRGDQRHVNRWAPFYTHSIRKGVDKKWVLWPLIREETWTADGLAHEKQQLFWFIYWSHEQRSTTNPALPHAHKSHFWPLFSAWDNGAGRHQGQFPSPLGVFFPTNDKVRALYEPLFALYRYDQRAPDDVRHAFLWRAITWRRTGTEREFHFIGPLFSSERDETGQRVELLSGLIGLRKPAGKNWRLFLFDFSHQRAKVIPTPVP